MSRRARHRDGQASVEYAVIVAFIAIIASAAIGCLRNQTNALFIAQGQTLGAPTLRVRSPVAYLPPATAAATATATPTPIPTATSTPRSISLICYILPKLVGCPQAGM